MNTVNKDIKELIKKAGIHQYEVADLIGIAETTLVRWLRYELTPERKALIINAIKSSNK